MVPTRQSGRRLREALANLAAGADQAVFPPRVIVPELLPQVAAAVPASASRLELTLAWVEVLLVIKLRAFRAVIPVAPPRRDFAWARALATRLIKVQTTLAEGGFRMADVAALADNPEGERWRQLAKLESAVERGLAKQSLLSRVTAERNAEAGITLPAGLREIVVIGAPDIVPVAIRYLAQLSQQVSVTVLIYGPPGLRLAEAFDAWGRPRSVFWGERSLIFPDFYQQVELRSDPSAQAAEIATLAATHPRPDEWLAVALGDPEIGPPLELELESRQLRAFNPEGVAWNQAAFYSVIRGFAALVDDPTAEAISELLRCPSLLDWWQNQEPNFVTATLLKQWDQLRSQHLVPDLVTAGQHTGKWPMLGRALNQLLAWRAELLTGDFADQARERVAQLYAHRDFTADSEEAEAAQRWTDTVAAVTRASVLLPDVGVGELWGLAVQTFGEGMRFETKEIGAVELGGWLELLWADAAHVVIAGCNEGRIPEAIVGDAFLPEGLRVKLGLKTNPERLARDAYVLAAAVGSRPTAAGVRILLGKTSSAGEPMRPSRLLLQGAGVELPGRVRHLFREIEAGGASLPWQRAWPLRPRWQPLKSSLSVTALRDWLACPFRFYLRRSLRMEPQELAKVELDARDFGSLLHGALETVSRDPTLRDCGDADRWREGLWSALDRDVAGRWGGDLSLPLVIQLESARQRLARAAVVQAEVWQQGWRIDRVEWDFALPLGGLTVNGKIDRIDRHLDGRVRVIDYKTSDRPVAPIEAHLSSLRPEDSARPEWLRVDFRGKAKRWVDLQLPLYRRALADEFGPEIECAYFNLPKAISETNLISWPEAMPELQVAAEACAAQVAEAIVRAEFWPPLESVGPRDDDWQGVFHHGTRASVDEDWIRKEWGR
jgi:ATP-dependent helicase/nuclease subunit B